MLPDVLHSCIAQQDCEKEVVVVDDGADSDIRSILEEFQDKICIKYIRSKHGGACHARNIGLAHATGEYVKFLDSDDILLENILKLEVKTARENGADVVISGWLTYRIDHNGKEIPGTRRTGTPPDIKAPLIDSIILGKAVPTSAALYRRRYINELKWDKDSGRLDDWDWFITVALKDENGRFVTFNEPSYCWRHHTEPQRSNVSMLDYAIAHHRILDRLTVHMDVNSLLTEKRKKRMAQYYYKQLQVFYENDRELFRQGIEKVHSLGGRTFLPKDSRYMMGTLLGVLGIEKALRLRVFLRDLLKRG